MNQSELRELLHDKADEFSLNGRIPTQIVRRAKRRVVLSTIGTGLALTLLLTSGGLLRARLPQGQSSPDLTSVPLAIDLVDYYDEDDHPGEDTGDDQTSRDEAVRHVACMREHGFDLPDPTRTENGWAILVEDPESLGFETPKWREAAFVDCRPPAPPGPGHLVMPANLLSEDDIEVFRSCMNAEGFALPAAVRGDGNVWRFDTASGNLDINSDAFHRALFVTCWPDEAR